MKKTILKATIILCGIMLLWSFPAIGEEWTAEQKEVWSHVEQFWKQVKEGNKAGVEEGIHEDAIGWETGKETPLKKPDIIAFYQNWMQYAIPVTYELKPYSIQIFGDIANVMYAGKWKAKEKYSGNFRTIVTFKKENGKWLSISWAGSSCEKPSKCQDW